jgi:NTE family protein
MRLIHVLFVSAALTLSGCGLIPYKTAANQALCPSLDKCAAPAPTRAVMNPEGLPKDVFVGVAISGGGMRAATFSAEVLFELETMGFLEHVSVISSVSGGSLTAAYFGLAANGKTKWDRETVERLFLIDLQTHWIAWWFNPHFIWQYWLTHFDRSDIMKSVFDFYIFDDVIRPLTFADMGTAGPRILINATSLPNVARFVFTEEEFRKRGSRLDIYPVSHAVMASGAFPGAFHNVTLKDFTTSNPAGGTPINDGTAHRYEHLFDGGPSDNLGVETLLDVLDSMSPKPKTCFLFVIDAYPDVRNRGRNDGDTRRWLDFLVDHNVSDSADVLLTLRRRDTLRRMNYREKTEVGKVSLWEWEFDRETRGHRCMIWHLTFDRFAEVRDAMARRREVTGELKAEQKENKKLLEDVNQVPTSYNLSGPNYMSPSEVQGRLRAIAKDLIWDDDEAREKACKWFRDQFGVKCPGERPSE